MLKDEIQNQDRLAELRAKIMIGIEELDRGDCAEWDVEEVKAEGRALLASKASLEGRPPGRLRVRRSASLQ